MDSSAARVDVPVLCRTNVAPATSVTPLCVIGSPGGLLGSCTNHASRERDLRTVPRRLASRALAPIDGQVASPPSRTG